MKRLVFALVLVLVCSLPATAAVTITNLYNNFNSGSSTLTTGSLSVTAGNLLVATCSGEDPANTKTISSMSDSGSNTWNSIAQVVSAVSGSGNYMYQRVFYAIVASTTTVTVTCTWLVGPNAYMTLLVDTVSGATFSGDPKDQFATGSGTALTSGTPISTSGTAGGTSTATELLYAVVIGNNAGTFTSPTFTPGSGTAVVSDGTQMTWYREVSSTQASGMTATVTPGVTQASKPYAMSFIAFVEGGGGGGGSRPCRRALLGVGCDDLGDVVVAEPVLAASALEGRERTANRDTAHAEPRAARRAPWFPPRQPARQMLHAPHPSTSRVSY